MKEKTRVYLDGDLTNFRKDWETRLPWPFDTRGVAVLSISSTEEALLRELLPTHPNVSLTEMVERSYSKAELLTFPWFTLWINCQVEVEDEGFVYSPPCTACGFCGERKRVHPLELTKRQLPKKDLAITDAWEIVVSSRVAEAWEAAGLTGATFSSILVAGQQSAYKLMTVESSVPDHLPGQLRYDGNRCPVCGRYDKVYPTHPSMELNIPGLVLPKSDIAFLNPAVERSYNHRKLLSNRGYRLLTELKATGWWVQPVHQIQ